MRQPLRGEAARDYILGSLRYSARRRADIPALAPRALGWYRDLLDVGLALPFGVVLDLGYLLLDGESFRFRSYFADTALDPAERAVRERYESRVLVRRLQEHAFGRLRRVLVDNPAQDLAITRCLEVLLRPAADALSERFRIDDPRALPAVVDEGAFESAAQAFGTAVGQSDILLRLVAEVAEHGPAMDLDRRLHQEDLYEIEHIRIFPRESLREVARRIKRVERLLGPPGAATARRRRERALAETSLASVGTYPVGGLAELTTRGPIENLAPTELAFLEPDEAIDPFMVRFAENELLKYLRDSAVLRMMRRTVVFVLDECLEFMVPLLAPDELRGTKVIRCLTGLVLALTADLNRIFSHDDVGYRLLLVAPEQSPAETTAERQAIAEVVHLLFAEKEEQGTVRVDVLDHELSRHLAELPREPGRFTSVVVLSRPDRLATLAGLRLGPEVSVTAVAVHQAAPDEAGRGDAAIDLMLGAQPLASLRAARERILEAVMAG